MEKQKPTYDLEAIKRAIGSGQTVAMTRTAITSAAELGFGTDDVAGVIMSVKRNMFFKSMTTFANHRVWQDVYHVPVEGLWLYIKFQEDVMTEFKVMSFKEL